MENPLKFCDFDELKDFILNKENNEHIQLWVERSRSIDGARKKGVKRYLNDNLKYYELTYRCIHSGSWKSRSTGIRPNRKTFRQQCPFIMKLRVSGDGKTLEVVNLLDYHSHPHDEISRRFSEEQTERFVKLYRKLEPLWNVSHPHYKKRSIRLACVEKIIEEMNLSDFSVKDVMVKIKYLRSTYSHEINKIHKSLLENEPDHIYQVSLKWFPDMDYIMKNCGTSRVKGDLSTLEFSENDLYYSKEEVVESPVEIEIPEQQDKAKMFENAESKEENPYRRRNAFLYQSQNFTSPQKFSEEQTMHFVKLYKESEPLWNVSHPDYRNKSVRIACLQKIIDSMNLPNFGPRDAMIKIRNLRSTYSQELRKIKKSLSEDEPGNIYQPILRWFPDMDYVMSKCGNSKAKSLLDLNYPDFYLGEEVIETPTDFDPSQQQDRLKVTEGATSKESDTLNPPEITASWSVKEKKPYRQNRRRILPKNHTKTNSINDQYQNFTVNKISEAVRELTSLTRTLRTQALQNEKVEDDCNIVGRHVALQLRELPPAVRLTAQLEIQKVLCNCRLNILETNETTSCSNT